MKMHNQFFIGLLRRGRGFENHNWVRKIVMQKKIKIRNSSYENTFSMRKQYN